MRRTAAVTNRVWLGVVGFVLLLVGLAGLAYSLGLLAVLGFGKPADRPLLGPQGNAVSNATWLAVVVGVVGVIIAGLAIAWLIAQVPRRDSAKPFRLHDDPNTGLTRCAPNVLTDAIATQLEELPGVTRARVVIRGTAAAPEVTARVTVSDDTDLIALTERISSEVVSDVASALDTRLRTFGVLVEIGATRKTPSEVVLA